MAGPPRAKLPWLLVGSSFLFAALLFYVLVSAYLPTKRRVARLEAELKTEYSREVDLQNRMALQEQRYALTDQRIGALNSERDTLLRRVEELERELMTRSARRTPTATPVRR